MIGATELATALRRRNDSRLERCANGVVFEVTPENETVWKFINPLKNMMGVTPAADGRPKLVEVFSNFTIVGISGCWRPAAPRTLANTQPRVIDKSSRASSIF